MGSGHFLVESVDYITDKMLDFLNGFPWNPVIAHLSRMRETILQEMEDQGITIDPKRLTDVNLLKRHSSSAASTASISTRWRSSWPKFPSGSTASPSAPRFLSRPPSPLRQFSHQYDGRGSRQNSRRQRTAPSFGFVRLARPAPSDPGHDRSRRPARRDLRPSGQITHRVQVGPLEPGEFQKDPRHPYRPLVRRASKWKS